MANKLDCILQESILSLTIRDSAILPVSYPVQYELFALLEYFEALDRDKAMRTKGKCHSKNEKVIVISIIIDKNFGIWLHFLQ